MTEVKVWMQEFNDSVGIYMREGLAGDWRRIHFGEPELLPLVLHEVVPPSLSLTYETAERLFQELYRVGFRPNKGESSVAHVEAMRAHLVDLQRLVFKEKK